MDCDDATPNVSGKSQVEGSTFTDSITVGTLVASPGGVFGHSSNSPKCSSVSTAFRGGSGVRARSILLFFSGLSSERPKRGILRLQGRYEM